LQQLSAPLLAARTQLLLVHGLPEKALEAADLGLAQLPTHPDLQAARIGALCRLERWQEANREAERLSDRASPGWRDRILADVLLSRARLELQDPNLLERAVPRLEQARELQPDRVDILVELVLAYGQWQRIDQAEVLVRSALEEAGEADRWDLQFALGMTHAAALRHAEASDCFGEVLQARPEHSRAAVELARCHLRAGRMDDAQRLLQACLEREPDSVGALLVQAELLLVQRDPVGATEALERVLERHPKHLPALYMLSRSLAMSGDREQQTAVLERYENRRRVLAERGGAP
jgi:tetratricopeptide (TPR) repeat protein